MTPHQADHSERRTITLAFHSMSDRLTWGSTNYSPRRFRALVERLRDSEFASDETSIEFTFDDGYAHLHDVLPDLIREFSIQPVVFIPTAFIGQTNSWDYGGRFRQMCHLNASEIQSLAQVGVIFGSHSHTHCDLTAISDSKLFEELSRSKLLLSEITGSSVTALSYPFGKLSPRVQSVAAECGYREGYTMSFPGKTDAPLSRGRIPVYCFDTTSSIKAKVRGEGFRFRIERIRTQFAQRLSAGTVLLQKLRGNRF